MPEQPKSMFFVFDDRPTESPYINTYWHTEIEHGGGIFTSTAASNWEMVITKEANQFTLTVRGPETQAMLSPIPEEADIFGINFKLGTYMPHLPARDLVNGSINLPDAGSRTFWLNGSAWEIPTFNNADIFVERLIREGLLVYEPVVGEALEGKLQYMSLRNAQRRFLHATGLTQKAIQQIERARHAAVLLQNGVSILDTVFQAGFFDQAHLSRQLKYFMGQTPAQIARQKPPE